MRRTGRAWAARLLLVVGGACAVGSAAGAQAADESALAQLERFASRYPQSPARPTALLQIAELLVRQADARFAAAQRAGSAAYRPDYSAPIARLQAIVTAYPTFDRIDAARYTLGVLYASDERFADAVPLLERAAASGVQPYAADARFRLGDVRLEMASRVAGAERRALSAEAARSYAAVAAAPEGAGDADLRILALYKLGLAHYGAADPAVPSSYEPALTAFGRLVDAFDTMGPEQQARIGLRRESLENLAVALARAGGAETVSRYFLRRGGSEKLAMLRRVAAALEEQGDDAGAMRALQVLRAEAPNDSGALSAQQAIVVLAEKRGLASEAAQAARLALVNDFAPNTAWAAANPALLGRAATLRLAALQRSAQLALSRAQAGERAEYPRAAELYGRLVGEFFGTPAGREARVFYAEALLGEGRYAEAGAAYGWAASALIAETRASDAPGRARAEQAARNSVVAYDSALARAPGDRAVQDSLFSATARLAAAFPENPSARQALVQMGRRASETQRWPAMETAFRTYVQRYPEDDFSPTAAKLIGDALYRQGNYAAAQQQWRASQEAARRRGRTALVDSIAVTRRAATTAYADSLVKRGEHWRAAEEAYVAFADAEPRSPAAPDALREAIETLRQLMRIEGRSAAEVAAARARIIDLSARLIRTYPDYPQRAEYQALRARMLVEAKRYDEAVGALQEQISSTAGTPGAAESRLRLALALDSAGQRARAAAAYEEFANAHPADRRAADALHNAAIAYADAHEPARAARAYGTFAARHPGDPRAGQARLTRLAMLRAAGDSAGAASEFRALCAQSRDASVRAECRDVAARRAFEQGVAAFRAYQPERLVIATRAELTAAGVQRASAKKLRLLRQAVAQFEEAIRAGSPEFVAAGTYYIGLAQYEYGDFLKHAQLPASLGEGERVAASNGAAAQAAQYYRAAEAAWRALGEKARTDPALASSARARPWLDRALQAAAGSVDRLGPSAVSTSP